mgnify:CR=1 FL=1
MTIHIQPWTTYSTLLFLGSIALVSLFLFTGVAVSGTEENAVDLDWLGKIQEDLRKQEYNVTWQESVDSSGIFGGYQAPNRAQGFRS